MGTVVAPLSEAIARALPHWHYNGPSLALCFGENQYLMGAIGKKPAAYQPDGLITFARSTKAWEWDWQGNYSEVAAGVMRIAHDPLTKSTSTTPQTLGTGSYTFAVTYQYPVGKAVRVSAGANNWMVGRVTASSPDSVTIWVSGTPVGAGTYSAWTLIVRRGIRVEEQRTNLLLQSAAGDAAITFGIGAGVTKGAGAAGSGISGGVSRAGSVAKNSSTGRAQQNAVVPAVTPHTASIFIRKPPSFNGEYCAFGEAAESSGLVVFNPFSGVIAATQSNVLAAKVTDFGAFWHIAVTRAVAGTTFAVAFFPFYNATGTAAEGSGVGSGYAHLVDGVQLEAGATPTSFTPTVASQVTRGHEFVAENVLPPWFNVAGGTAVMVFSVDFLGSAKWPGLFEFQADNSNRIGMFITDQSTDRAVGLVRVGNVNQVVFEPTVPVIARATTKVALSYAANNFAMSKDGAAPVTDSLGALPTVTRLKLGYLDDFLNGVIESFEYHPRVTDTQQASV